MSIIYLESTVSFLISSGEKEKVEELIKSGQVREQGIILILEEL